MGSRDIRLTVNGQDIQQKVDDRKLLSDFIREDLGLTGTHVGCEQGACGACTVFVDGRPARSCLAFAVQVDGASITTIEGIQGDAGELHPVQRALHSHHGLQCGFCTPGVVISACALLADNASPTEEDVREGMSGNLCRCTGYQGIVAAIMEAASSTTRSSGVEK